MAAALHGVTVGQTHDPLDFFTGIDARIVSHAPVLATALRTAEIESAGEFADADKVHAFHQIGPERRTVEERGECGHGADVGVKPQLFAHRQQSMLRPDARRGVVIIFGRADGAIEDGVATHAELVGGLRIRIAHGVNSAGAREGCLRVQRVAKFFADGAHHFECLIHHFRAYSVARQNGNVELHIE